MSESYRVNDALGKITQWIVLIYQTIAVLIFAASMILGLDWLNDPFIGGMFEQTMVLNGTDTRQPGEQWALYEEGFKIGDQLVSVDGHPILSGEDLHQTLITLQIGQSVPVEMRTSEGEVRTVDVTLESFSTPDRVAFFAIPMFMSAVFLGLSLWIFGLRRTEAAGRAFSMMTTSIAIVIGSLFDLYSFHYFTYAWTLAAALSGGAVIDLGLCFPQEARLLLRRPYLRWFGYVVGIALAVSAFSTLYDFQNPTAYFGSWRNIYIFIGVSALIYFGALTINAFFTQSPVVKSQARTILLGALLAFGPIVFWLLYSSWRNAGGTEEAVPFNPYLFVPFILFPLANGYVILRFRLLRTDYWVRQGMVYFLLTVLAVAAYGLLVTGIGLIASNFVSANNPYLIGGLVFLIAVFLEPLRAR
ncbi:MAG TPA: hypothetical protein VFH34_04300, partial [Anaerolineales bacterium]|nr:hypothetical protein [Anaerolineales bacterium]